MVEQLLDHVLFVLTCLWNVSSEPHAVRGQSKDISPRGHYVSEEGDNKVEK